MVLDTSRIPTLLLGFIVGQYFLRRHARRVRYEVAVLRHGSCVRSPTPPSWDPIFNLDSIFANLKARVEHRVLKLDQANFTKHGDTLLNPFFGRGAIQTANVENAQAILSARSSVFAVARDWALSPLLGLGIVDTDEPDWTLHRTMAKRAFARSQINDAQRFGVHFSRMMDQIPQDGSTVDLRPLFELMNMDAQSEFCFGESLETLVPHNEPARRFMHHLSNAMSGCSKRLFAGPWSWLIQHRSSYWESCRLARSFLDGLIDKALARDDDDDKSDRVLVYEYARQTENSQQLLDRLFNVFMPGKDTPGTLLGHVLFACARNPDVWTRLRDEVRANDIQLPRLTLAKLASLEYMQSVITETLRLYPVLDQTARTARVATTLPRGGGPSGRSPILLLPGTVVVINFWCMNRREDIYGPDAHLFRPERWDDNPALLRDFNPFSRGPRVCPGQSLALFWVGYALCGMAQRIDSVENRDEVDELVEDIALTHASLNGVKVGLRFRE